MQISLGVQLHSQYASYNLIESLHAMGLCCSFKTARKYEKSATITFGTDVPEGDKSFIQYIADNVDQNICTIDGNGTFNGMGIIAAVTPKVKFSKVIPKRTVSSQEITDLASINIIYQKNPVIRDSMIYTLHEKSEDEFTRGNLDLLWRCSVLFGKPVPSWAGVMQMFHRGSHPGQSSIKFLPMIDMSSSDPTCIYSTLSFIADHAKRYNSTPIITFDQPLWWKAYLMVASEECDSRLKSIVVRLGGFTQR